jgi:rubrerythrin
MSITFSADEIFEMAEDIERQGALFYREAAEKSQDKQTRKFLLDMATMEEGHDSIFADMRKNLSSQAKQPLTFDPDNQAGHYLLAMAEAHGTEGKVSADFKLTGNESITDIINIGVNAERNSVCFYTGLKELVPSAAGKEQVDEIIKEELSHITILLNKLKTLD